MSLRTVASHPPESICCLLSGPKKLRKSGTRSPLPKQPFPYHCPKGQMVICGAHLHPKAHAGLTESEYLWLFSPSPAPGLKFSRPPFSQSPRVLSSLRELSHLHRGATLVLVRAFAVCPWSLEPSAQSLTPSWASVVLESSLG